MALTYGTCKRWPRKMVRRSQSTCSPWSQLHKLSLHKYPSDGGDLVHQTLKKHCLSAPLKDLGLQKPRDYEYALKGCAYCSSCRRVHSPAAPRFLAGKVKRAVSPWGGCKGEEAPRRDELHGELEGKG